MRAAGLLLTLVALGACVPRSTAPQPIPAPQPIQRPAPITSRPAPAPQPTPAPRPPAPSNAWLDAPLSAGAWSYRGAGSGGGSTALFGSRAGPLLTIRCEPGRRVSLTRTGASGAITFRTSSTSRTLSGPAVAADDPLLDALAFSRGRFGVEAGGAAALVVPAWPELARVVEDCRR